MIADIEHNGAAAAAASIADSNPTEMDTDNNDEDDPARTLADRLPTRVPPPASTAKDPVESEVAELMGFMLSAVGRNTALPAYPHGAGV